MAFIDKKLARGLCSIANNIVGNGIKGSRIHRGSDDSKKYKKFVTQPYEVLAKEYGQKPGSIIKEVLQDFISNKGLEDKYDVNVQHFYGQVLHPYIWGVISIKDGERTSIPYSYTPQLYVLFFPQGVRFGFCYGDRVKNDSSCVSYVINNKKRFAKLLEPVLEIKDFLITNKSNDAAGHSNPDEKYHLDEELKDIISKEWNDEIHVIKSVPVDKITNNIQKEIESMFDSVFNFFTESSTQNSVGFSEKNGLENFSVEDALKELFIDKDKYQNIVELLTYKKNLILQGPPGVGKSFISSRIAFSMMGVKDNKRLEKVQFHQSYSYEDFIRGYRPDEDGKLQTVDGIFMKFCEKARNDSENDYFFIIDEINRGNLSKIFGELMFLIEKDKRGETVKLAYENPKKPGENFSIPDNIFLIGTMNTADRSLAMVDYALRRRFVFYSLEPQFDSPKFELYLLQNKVSKSLTKKILEKLKALNVVIEKDEKYLGSGYKIGHSYFCPDSDIKDVNEDWYKKIIDFEVKPLLEEYWFDNLDKAKTEIKKLY